MKRDRDEEENDYLYSEIYNNLETLDGVEKELDIVRSEFESGWSVDSLEYLYRGGRLDKASYVIGGLANIKPIIAVNAEGKIEVITKVIGAVKAMRIIQERMQAGEPDTNYPIYSAYTSGTYNVVKLESKLSRANSL